MRRSFLFLVFCVTLANASFCQNKVLPIVGASFGTFTEKHGDFVSYDIGVKGGVRFVDHLTLQAIIIDQSNLAHVNKNYHRMQQWVAGGSLGYRPLSSEKLISPYMEFDFLSGIYSNATNKYVSEGFWLDDPGAYGVYFIYQNLKSELKFKLFVDAQLSSINIRLGGGLSYGVFKLQDVYLIDNSPTVVYYRNFWAGVLELNISYIFNSKMKDKE